MPEFVERGKQRALQALGLGEDHTLRNLALAGAGAAPFLGLIGQQSLRHDPYRVPGVAPRMSVHELMQHAQPGDIAVMREAKPTLFRRIHEAITGTPYHHTEPVVGKKDLYFGTTVDVAEHATPAGQLESVKEQLGRAKTLGERAAEKGYQDIVLLRPKQFAEAGGQVTPEIERFVNKAILESRKPYSFSTAFSTALKDLFVPKVPGVTPRHVVCKGNTCTTLTEEALHAATGKSAPVVAGKGVGEGLPADLLRSKEMDIIGHTSPLPEAERLLAGRRAMLRGLGLRAGLGLGLAGGTYALSEDPVLASTLGGAAAAPMIARRIAGKGKEGQRAIRPFRHLMNVMHETSPAAKAIKKNILRRTLPLALGGGLLTYLGAKGIQRLAED